MSDCGFAVGDEVEVVDYKAMAGRWDGEVFTIARISGDIACESGKAWIKPRASGFGGNMYLRNLRHTSRPEDFICDI